MRQFTTTVLSDLTISAEWIREIKETTGRNVLFHIYSGNLNKKSILNIMNQLRYSFPDAKIVGTESGGEIKDGKMMTIGTLISCIVFDTTDIEVVIYDDLAGNERKIGTLLKTDIDARLSEDIKAVELLLPGALMDTLHMYEELEKCDQSVCIFGGYAGNHDADLDNAFVFVDGEIKDNAVIAVMYKGKDFHVNTSKSAGWQKLGVPFKITKADGNILHEINETPAAEIYKRYLNIDTDDLIRIKQLRFIFHRDTSSAQCFNKFCGAGDRKKTQRNGSGHENNDDF